MLTLTLGFSALLLLILSLFLVCTAGTVIGEDVFPTLIFLAAAPLVVSVFCVVSLVLLYSHGGCCP